MPLFGKGKDDSKQTIAVMDFGTGSVGCALATLDRKGAPTIVAEVRSETIIDTTRSGERLADRVLKAGADASKKIAAQAAGLNARETDSAKISHVAVFLPAPWSTLYLRNVRLARNEAFNVNPGVIERMVSDYVRRERPDEKTEEIIERSATGIRLNGYAVDEIPKKGTATSVELAIVSATAPKVFLEAVRDVVRASFGHVSVSFHSTSLAGSYALSVIVPENPDYIFCNGEGEITELLLVLEHTPSGAATATAACNTILRTVSVHADMARAEASSALALAKDSRSPMADKLGKTLSSAQKECADGFYEAGKELIAQGGAPRVVYVAGLGEETSWYADAIAKATFLKELFPAGVAVETVKYPTLAPHLKRGNIAGTPAKIGGDIFLALETLYLDARFDQHRAFNFRLK